MRRAGDKRGSAGEETRGIFREGRHHAVAGGQHRSGEALKIPLLILPRSAEMARQAGILMQFRISVRREELPVGIHVDRGSGKRVEQTGQRPQVVAGHQHRRTFPGAAANLHRHGVAEFGGLHPPEQIHRGTGDAPAIEQQFEHLARLEIRMQRIGKSTPQIGENPLIPAAETEHPAVEDSDTTDSGKEQRQTGGQFVPEPQAAAGDPAALRELQLVEPALRKGNAARRRHLAAEPAQLLLVKIGSGRRSGERGDNQAIETLGRRAPLHHLARQLPGEVQQQILKRRNFGTSAANAASAARTADSVLRQFTIQTQHAAPPPLSGEQAGALRLRPL